MSGNVSLWLAAQSDNEEEAEEEEESESEGGEDREASSRSSACHYPSRRTRLTRNCAAGDKTRAGNTRLLCSSSKPEQNMSTDTF